jgi:hypothetical protein
VGVWLLGSSLLLNRLQNYFSFTVLIDQMKVTPAFAAGTLPSTLST